jgi:hypothetical protein
MSKRFRMMWITMDEDLRPISKSPTVLSGTGADEIKEEEYIEPSHSPDFASITQDGITYTFSEKQRAMVNVLWKARGNNSPWVTGDLLLEAAESLGSRVNHLFRGHPAWGVLILSGALHGETPGTYRLANPKKG